MCASLPKLTASPPSSRNQRTSSTEASGLVVLTSSARPVSASARNTSRYSASKGRSAYRSRPPGQYRRGKSTCASTSKTSLSRTIRAISVR